MLMDGTQEYEIIKLRVLIKSYWNTDYATLKRVGRCVYIHRFIFTLNNLLTQCGNHQAIVRNKVVYIPFYL